MAHVTVGVLKLFSSLAAVVILVALFAGSVRIEADLERAKATEIGLVRSGAATINGILAAPLRHVTSLPHERLVRSGIENPTPNTLAGITEAFITLLQRNPPYDQARWIDETGMERVRVDRNPRGGMPLPVSSSRLQDKSDRAYFRETMKLAVGTLYVSQFDLNVENGAVEIPIKPMLRVAVPVADLKGNRRGIFIINILGQDMLDGFRRAVGDGSSDTFLLNRNGFWLSNSDQSRAWGFMFGRDKDTLSYTHPNAWSKISDSRSGQFVDDDGLWTWQTISGASFNGLLAAEATEPHWLVVSHVPATALRAMSVSVWAPTVLIALPLLLLLGGMSWLLAMRSHLRIEAMEARAKAEAVAEERHHRLLALEAAQRSSAMLAAVVESTEDAVISKTLKGVITSWNPGAERLFGFTAQEAIGHPMLMLFPPDREAEEQDILARVAAGEAIGHFDTIRRHKDGHLIDVSVTISPIRDGTGQIIGASKIARDITETKRDEAELQRYRSHLETLVGQRTEQLSQSNQRLREREKFITTVTDNLPGMVGYWDRDLRCRFANRAYVAWFGLPADQINGMSMRDLLGEEMFQLNRSAVEGALAGKEQHFERTIRKSSGEMGHALAYYIPDHNGDEVIGFFVLVSDVTPLKLAEAELRAINEKLEAACTESKAAELAKSQFLANMSHEIRTPMNAILGFAEVVLQDPQLSPQSQRHLQTILGSARALLGIINDILDISKLESGKFALESVCFHLPNALADTMRLMEHHAAESNLRIMMHYDTHLPVRVVGDPTRLRQVLINLVGNAIKFTKQGSVSLSVLPDEQPDMLHFAVADTGIGMTPEQVKSVFMPFSQADSSMTRRFGGTGLGTSISKQIVEMMGGRIWIESELDKGTVFHFTVRLPQTFATEGCLYEDGGAVASGFMSPRIFKVLLAEDIEANAILATFRLREQGHEVEWVKDGNEALAAYGRHDHDLILMDVMMPDKDGLETTREIRAMEKDEAGHIPIIALTASVMPEDNEKCLAAGMDVVVAKPVAFNHLLSTMEQIVPAGVGTVRQFCQIEFSAPSTVDLLPLDSVADTASALKSWRSVDAYARALISFAADCGQHADEIDHLLTLYPEDDEPARAVAHALKGGAGNLQLSRVCELATSIDTALKAKKRAAALALLDELRQALANAVDAIGRLERAVPPVEHLAENADSTQLHEVFRSLLAALEGLAPDEAEPCLEQLSHFLPKAELSAISRAVDAFDFDAAEANLRILASKLGLHLD